MTDSYKNHCLAEDSEAVRNGAGKNIIPPPEKDPLWKLYLEKFKDPIIIVLLVVFFFSILVAVYEIVYMGKGWEILIEPSGVLTALLLATGVGFIFELKADKEFEVLNKVKDSSNLSFIEIKSSIGAREDLGRPTTTAIENKENFMSYINK